jgi:hypothetical protein
MRSPAIRSAAILLVAVLSAGALSAAALAPAARADGDPASDVLVSQRAYVPADAGAGAAALAQVQRVVAAAAAGGYPVRVAIIASPADLGSVTALWHRPEDYARFLGQELSLAAPSRVLVVMPGGFGLYQAGRSSAAERAALATRVPGPAGAGLVAAASAAVERLAAAAGVRLPPGAALGSAASRPAGGGGSDLAAWLVFAAGCALVALAWAFSLRARPLRVRAAPRP